VQWYCAEGTNWLGKKSRCARSTQPRSSSAQQNATVQLCCKSAFSCRMLILSLRESEEWHKTDQDGMYGLGMRSLRLTVPVAQNRQQTVWDCSCGDSVNRLYHVCRESDWGIRCPVRGEST
jgi:hypothetical protein